MCGIARIYRSGDAPLSTAWHAEGCDRVTAMLAAVEHRCPNDHGLEQAGRVRFGVRRGSILDVAHGDQPLSDTSGRVRATQNGELYDFPPLRVEFGCSQDLVTGIRLRRRLAERHLPAGLAPRHEHGLAVPIEDWLQDPLDTLSDDTLAGAGSGLFQVGVIRRSHDAHCRRVDRSSALSPELSLEMWRREIAAADASQPAERARPLGPSRVMPILRTHP